jgi:hypothetical protein
MKQLLFQPHGESAPHYFSFALPDAGSFFATQGGGLESLWPKEIGGLGVSSFGMTITSGIQFNFLFSEPSKPSPKSPLDPVPAQEAVFSPFIFYLKEFTSCR